MADERLSILVLAPNPWNGPRMNRQHLFSRIARQHDVLYSTGLHFFSGVASYRPLTNVTGRTEHTDGLTVDHTPSWMVRNLRSSALDDLVVRVVAQRWRRMLADSFVAYLFHPSFWPYVRFLRPGHIVYHAYDLYDHQVSWCDQFARWERELLARASLVVASSAMIRDRLMAVGGRDVMLLENAGDYDLFAAGSARPEPEELSRIPRPRVGYSGAINQKVDLTLVETLARRRPDVHFVLVGRVAHLDTEMESARRRLQTLANVHFIGQKAYSLMPAYVAHMDVNAIWNRVGAGLWTEGTFPLKLHECLAAGPPVVVSDIPALRQFASVIQIAQSPDDWDRALGEALGERAGAGREARQLIASRNTWDARAAQLEHAIVNVTQRV